MRLAIVLCEFGKPAPDVSQYRETWPDADIQIFMDADVPPVPNFDGPRYGWRMNDYWKVRMLLDSGADIAISFDADMRIVNREDARTLPLLTERFGLCLPMNPRSLVRVDTLVGADSDRQLDETRGCAMSLNCSPIALNLGDRHARRVANKYCQIMLDSPVRGPLAWWRAIWQCADSITYHPCVLPPQWCVCEADIGIGNEVILHEGHESVKRHYAGMRCA